MIYLPYIDRTNYTDFINNDVVSSTTTWLQTYKWEIIQAVFFILMLYIFIWGKDRLPLVLYCSFLAVYHLIWKQKRLL